MGLYKGIRNPRSHEIIKDKREDADAIILFIDYVIRIINKSNPTFTIEDFLVKVFDPDFVEKDEYAIELIKDIPKKKLGEVIIEVYRNRRKGNAEKLKYLVYNLLPLLNSSDFNSLINVVSDELGITNTFSAITTTRIMFPHDFWQRIKKAPKMRIENKFINSIKKGEVMLHNSNLRKGDPSEDNGALGSWSKGLMEYFSLKDELINTLIHKLEDTDLEDTLYVIGFFHDDMPKLFTTEKNIRICARAYKRLITCGVKNVSDLMLKSINCSDLWQPIFIKEFDDLTDELNPSFYFPDGTPFLGKEKEIPEYTKEDEIPF